jgi:hypothetical protein
LGFGDDVIGAQDIADNRRRVGAGLPDLLYVLFFDAADGDDWNFHPDADLPQAIEAASREAGGFRLRAEHRTEADVIGAVSLGLLSLFDIMRGNSDDLLSDQFFAGGEGEIVLSEVNAVGVTGQGDIDAIIDD